MASFLYDTQEIFFLAYSPCWSVLLAFVIAGGVLVSVRHVIMAIWARRGGLTPPLPDDNLKGGD